MDQGNGPVCQCLPGFGGPECEKLLSVNFVDRDTYLQFTSCTQVLDASLLRVLLRPSLSWQEAGSMALAAVLAQTWSIPPQP